MPPCSSFLPFNNITSKNCRIFSMPLVYFSAQASSPFRRPLLWPPLGFEQATKRRSHTQISAGRPVRVTSAIIGCKGSKIMSEAFMVLRRPSTSETLGQGSFILSACFDAASAKTRCQCRSSLATCLLIAERMPSGNAVSCGADRHTYPTPRWDSGFSF